MVLKSLPFSLLFTGAFCCCAQEADVYNLFSRPSAGAPQAASSPAHAPSVLEKGYVSPAPAATERPDANAVARAAEGGRIVERPVTCVVEKVVYDRSAERKLQAALTEQTERGERLQAETAELQARNDDLTDRLAAERERTAQLERLVPKAPRKLTGRPARITSAVTCFDRKQGVAFFDNHVHVDDEQYQLHADRAYVFMDGSNDVRRIVAIGNVAMTNESRRAYGAKVSYYKEGGMVVLYSGDGIAAEVRDESKEQDQVVRGKKIKFWIQTEQVEVLEADISAPTGGMGKGGLKSGFNKIIGK